jgi:hypothetical protein
MSAYQAQPHAGGTGFVGGMPQAVRRPGLLTAALTASGAAALLVILSQVLSFAKGKDAIQDSLRDQLGSQAADLANSLFAAELDDAYSTLKSRAVIGIVLAVIVLALTLVARGAAIGARVGLIIALLFMGGLEIVSVGDVFPSAGKAIGTVAIILVPIAIVLCLLPPVNAFGRSRKARA